ncbi:type II toxin-antitoxin system antitoxin SocA domain-containing protein [Salinicola sp. CPA57]|uniref:Panacea domain-containing protein n=1 Tax=Salinicola sp. CPA57 TaxID=1949080 RepID=UPI000DA1245C|nr:type II toxin-antitoxin system antitoxin SocA domain-containing protein [Salinicola sp. CPA57]
MAISAMQAAKIACEASGWKLSNLQLHKILYLAHMVYSGDHDGSPLIEDERFQAWAYGPVLPSVYRYASSYGSSSIQNIFNHVPPVAPWSDEYKTIVDAVASLGEMAPFQLVEITHEPGSAWSRSYSPDVRNVTINQDDILREYQSRFAKAEH